ncbi:MAG: ThiF family adenylyltransferase [Sulfuricella sp.]|nr:ThiF family adenylyltransferase [Sulfuricella sp.]
MLEEKRALEALSQAEPWCTLNEWSKTAEGDLALSFRLSLLILNFDGLLVYPALFPETPAYIRPQKKGEQWSEHQYGGAGVLCLEHGPDNWHGNVTGADLVRSAYKLLVSETVAAVLETSPNTPSRHQQTLGQQLRFERKRCVVTSQLRKLLHAMLDATREPIRTSINFVGDVSTTVVTQFGEGENARIKDVPDGVNCETFGRQGWAVCDQRLVGVPACTTLVELRATLEGLNCWPWVEELDETYRTLLLNIRGREPRLFTLCGGAEPGMWECKVASFDRDDAQRLPEQFSTLGNEWVAIVGLGSVGSKIAASLVRSGIRNFVLLDDDVLAPQNLVRHQLTWRAVGFHKIEGVAQELRLISQDVKVICKSFRIAGQENPQSTAELLSILSLCRFVVDATASTNVFVTLAAICKRMKSTLIWGEIFPGGAGALMARSRPGADADPLSVRNHINGCLDTFPPAPDKRAMSYDLMTEGNVVVAGDAEVSMLAASMTQFVLDALCAPEKSQFPVSAYLMGYKKYWVFEQPFMTISFDASSISSFLSTFSNTRRLKFCGRASASSTRTSTKSKSATGSCGNESER